MVIDDALLEHANCVYFAALKKIVWRGYISDVYVELKRDVDIAKAALKQRCIMSGKAATIDQKNCNKVSGDAGFETIFGKDAPFSIACNKCGSMDIDILANQGNDYEDDGYSPGETAIQCNKCGAAQSVWN